MNNIKKYTVLIILSVLFTSCRGQLKDGYYKSFMIINTIATDTLYEERYITICDSLVYMGQYVKHIEIETVVVGDELLYYEVNLSPTPSNVIGHLSDVCAEGENVKIKYKNLIYFMKKEDR